jgi:hypothetical protein
VPTPLEAEISSLLREMRDPASVADELARRWERNLLSEPEQADCAQFFVASGLYVRLFGQVVRLVEDGQLLPWTALAEAIGRARIRLVAHEISSLVQGAEAQNAIPELLRSRQLDAWHPDLLRRRSLEQQEQLERIKRRKQELKEKLEFMRNNHLQDEEAKVLAEVQNIFPGDPEFQHEQEAYQLRWAKEVISNSSTTTDLTQDLIWKSEKLAPEQEIGKDLIVRRAKVLAAEHPERAYDLALGLHFMEMHAEAIEVLNEGTSAALSPSDWLRLELMISARQFVNALDEASQLELKYAGLPDTAFAVVYSRARALWGLGQKAMATELLRSLVRIRPQYRSAHSLLMEWTSGGEET